jgi:hypothetical protein
VTSGVDTVLRSQDIPLSSQTLSAGSVKASDTGATAGPGTTVTDMWIRNNVVNVQFANKDTRFENLVFAITAGYASSPEFWRTDTEFAVRACNLARAIAYEMAKYATT